MTKMPKNLNTCPKEEIISFLGSFDNVLTDCDGKYSNLNLNF